MVTYVKRKGSQYDTWHWCKNCSNYPTGDVVTSDNPSDEKCNECKAKKADGTCRI